MYNVVMMRTKDALIIMLEIHNIKRLSTASPSSSIFCCFRYVSASLFQAIIFEIYICQVVRDLPWGRRYNLYAFIQAMRNNSKVF